MTNENAATEASILAIARGFDPKGGIALVCVLENSNLLSKVDMRRKRVLEIGCGCLPACFGVADEQMPAEYVATDASAKLVEAAKKVDSRPTFFVQDRLNFPAEYFDLLILRGVLHHLPSPAEALIQMRSFLKPGGELLIYEPNTSSLVGNALKWALWIFFRINMEDSPYGQMPRNSIHNIVRGAGFTVKEEWFSSLLAFVLSGDYGRRLVLPNWRWLFRLLVCGDRFLSRLLHSWPPLARITHLRVIFLSIK